MGDRGWGPRQCRLLLRLTQVVIVACGVPRLRHESVPPLASGSLSGTVDSITTATTRPKGRNKKAGRGVSYSALCIPGLCTSATGGSWGCMGAVVLVDDAVCHRRVPTGAGQRAGPGWGMDAAAETSRRVSR